jgi:hypothetical protein
LPAPWKSPAWGWPCARPNRSGSETSQSRFISAVQFCALLGEAKPNQVTQRHVLLGKAGRCWSAVLSNTCARLSARTKKRRPAHRRMPPCPPPARLGATTHRANKAQEVGRKQDRNEDQVDVVVIRSPQRLDTKVHGGSGLGLIRWRCCSIHRGVVASLMY